MDKDSDNKQWQPTKAEDYKTAIIIHSVGAERESLTSMEIIAAFYFIRTNHKLISCRWNLFKKQVPKDVQQVLAVCSNFLFLRMPSVSVSDPALQNTIKWIHIYFNSL